MSNGPILYPNVTSLPGQTGLGQAERAPRKQEGVKGEFDEVFEKVLGGGASPAGRADLGQVRAPLKFSAHASQRLQERKISLDPATMSRVADAIDKAEAKGVEDTLVLTKDAALIVSVKNRTVITALDRNNLSGNVFTNIDGAVVV
jgi:flagellar operon protein